MMTRPLICILVVVVASTLLSWSEGFAPRVSTSRRLPLRTRTTRTTTTTTSTTTTSFVPRLSPLFADRVETKPSSKPVYENVTKKTATTAETYMPPALQIISSSSSRTTKTPMLRFMGMEITPTIIAIATIYFVEGGLGLARLAQTYLLKDELHLGPAEMSALSGLFVLPWTIKPLYGFVSDSFPLFGYKRKSYLVVAGLLGAVTYALLGKEEIWQNMSSSNSIAGTVLAMIVGSACIAMADVVADGIVVTKTRQANDDPAIAGGLQSLCWGSAAAGGLLSAYFSGSLLEVMSVRSVFGLTAILPFLVAIIALTMEEVPVSKQQQDDESQHSSTVLDNVQEQVQALWGALKQPSIWRPTLFLFLWQSTPTSDGAFFFFLSNDLGLGPEFLGRVRLVTAAAGLIGVFLYNQYFKTAKIKDILFWSTLASFPLGLLPVLLVTHANRALGIPDTALIYGDDVVLAALGQMSFMPTLVLAARLCPEGVEAVLFATLMSIFNGAGTVGTEVGALMTKALGVTDTNFDNLPLLTVLCSVTSLYPLAFIGWLDGVGDMTEEEMENENNKKGAVAGVVVDVEATNVQDDLEERPNR